MTDNEEAFQALKEELKDYIVELDRYEKGKVVGKGGYGTCYLATDKKTGKQVALKELNFEELSGSKLKEYCCEIRVLSLCSHPCLLPLRGFTITPPYAIITKFVCNQSLYNWLYNDDLNLSGTQKTVIAMGVAAGMARLHEQNVIHRDLKSPNVLLDKHMIPKVCDFGISTIAEMGDDFIKTRRIGTPAWTAPEMFAGASYSNKVDVYSYGMLLYEMITGERPFKKRNGVEIMKAVVERQERPPMPIHAPYQLKQLIQICWNSNPAKRPSFETIYEMFASEKVQFPRTDIEEVRELKKRLDDWKESTTKKLASAVDHGNLDMRGILKSRDPAKIMDMTNLINVNNLCTFLDAVYEVIREKEPKEVIKWALFDLLIVITEKEDCLKEFALKSDFMSFSYEDPELRDLSLSLYLPVCEKFPNTISDTYIDFLQSLILKAPLKVMRLFSTLVQSYTDTTANWVVCDLICVKYQVFLKKGAGRALLHTLYGMIDHLEEFRKSRSQICVTIFAACLRWEEDYVVELSLNALLALKPQSFPCSTEDVLKLLNNPNHENTMLQLLCVSRPSASNFTEILSWLINNASGCEVATLALVSLVQNPDIGSTFLKQSEQWLTSKRPGVPCLDVGLRMQLLMATMLHPGNRPLVSQVPSMEYFFNECIEDKDLERIETMYIIIRRIPVDPNFVSRLASSGFIKNYLTIIKEMNFEQVYIKGYLVIDCLCRQLFTPDFLLLVPAALEHLKCGPNLKRCAATYLTLMTCFQDAFQSLIAQKVPDLLRPLIDADDLIERALSNLQTFASANS